MKIGSDEEIDHIFAQLEEHRKLTQQLSDRQFDLFNPLKNLYITNDLFNSDAITKDLDNIKQLETLVEAGGAKNAQDWIESNFNNQNISKNIDEVNKVNF